MWKEGPTEKLKHEKKGKLLESDADKNMKMCGMIQEEKHTGCKADDTFMWNENKFFKFEGCVCWNQKKKKRKEKYMFFSRS